MERIILIIIIFVLIGAYWGHTLITWNQTSDDGVAGKSVVGVILTAGAIVLLFNLGLILNS